MAASAAAVCRSTHVYGNRSCIRTGLLLSSVKTMYLAFACAATTAAVSFTDAASPIGSKDSNAFLGCSTTEDAANAGSFCQSLGYRGAGEPLLFNACSTTVFVFTQWCHLRTRHINRLANKIKKRRRRKIDGEKMDVGGREDRGHAPLHHAFHRLQQAPTPLPL